MNRENLPHLYEIDAINYVMQFISCSFLASNLVIIAFIGNGVSRIYSAVVTVLRLNKSINVNCPGFVAGQRRKLQML